VEFLEVRENSIKISNNKKFVRNKEWRRRKKAEKKTSTRSINQKPIKLLAYLCKNIKKKEFRANGRGREKRSCAKLHTQLRFNITFFTHKKINNKFLFYILYV
jgi:hypothetical protein